MPGTQMSTGGTDFRATPSGYHTGVTDGPSTIMTIGGKPVGSTGISPQEAPASVDPTDWANIAGAGIGAAGATVGTLAQLAGQKAAWDQQAMQNQAYLGLSEKLAKMRLGQQQNQFDMTQALAALDWALRANQAYQRTGVGGRELRRTSSDLLGDALRRLYLPTRR